MGQLSFYSADARPRGLPDLEGVLCAVGEVSLFGRGAVARLSIVLGDPPCEQPEPDPPPEQPEPDPGAGDPGNPGPAEDRGPLDVGAPDRDREERRRPADRPGVDPEDLAFLDLDPDELAALLSAPAREADPPPPPEGRAPEPDPVAEWRAHALCCAFAARGVDAEIERAPDGRPVVRSAYRADLAELARQWTKGPEKVVPDDLELDGPRLRLWVLAAGRVHGHAYLLGLDPDAVHMHEPLLTASRRAGLGADLRGDPDHPVLRIVGRRRRRRLAELVGDRPRSVVDGVWPDDWAERPN